MKLKIQVNPDSGAVYVAAIVEGEHRQTATLIPGQEVEVLLPDNVALDFGPVTGTGTTVEQPAEDVEDVEEKVADVEPPAAEEPQDDDTQENGMPAGLAIGRTVIYRSKTGKYDLPAIVNATVASLDPEGVALGHVPELYHPGTVHLTVFTCGRQGTARTGGGTASNEAAGGSYQEFNVPMSGFTPETATEEDGEPQPGTWRFSERV